MKSYGISFVFAFMFIHALLSDVATQCGQGRSATFARWSGVAPDTATPVFVYAASGEEDSLTGACISRCKELEDCAAVIVLYSKGNCHGLAASADVQLKVDNDAAYFTKICLPVPEECSQRWWALESTPGYHLHSDSSRSKLVTRTTVKECYEALLVPNREKLYRSAQWIAPEEISNTELMKISDTFVGNCVLHQEDKFTEPESYRVSNYFTYYMENQCRHDYLKKIDRCSYEEYNNQTLKHVEFTINNYTRDECKRACETETRFICRGFTWRQGRGRGACDLHSEDLVTTGSWLLRRTSLATYYRRVICLNMSVECEDSNLVVIYRPRGVFRGRMYVPGHGENCSARTTDGIVRLSLPMHGDCDVNFAYGISHGPNGVINRTMAYVMVMIQTNPIIQTAGDRWVRVGCSPGIQSATRVNATVSVRDTGKPSSSSEFSSAAGPEGASAIYGASSVPLTMYVVRGGESEASQARSEHAGAVALGEPLELRVETSEAAEIYVYHLVASSRLGDSSVLLLDNKGCPTGQVDFPSFTRSWLSGTQRLSARFKAFRFPTSHVVRFALMVRFCDGKCPQSNCHKTHTRTARQANTTFYNLEAVNRNARNNVVAQGGPTDCGCGGGGKDVVMYLEMQVDSREVLSADTMIRADHRSTDPEVRSEMDGAVVCIHELLIVALALAWLAVQVLLLVGCCILVKSVQTKRRLTTDRNRISVDVRHGESKGGSSFVFGVAPPAVGIVDTDSRRSNAEAHFRYNVHTGSLRLIVSLSSLSLVWSVLTIRYRNLAELSMQKDYHSFDNVGFETGSTHRRVHWSDQNIDIIHT